MHQKSSFSSSLIIYCSSSSLGSGPVHRSTVRNAIQQLKSAPAYTEILRLEQQPEPKKDKKCKKSQPPPPSAEPELTEQEVAGQSLLDKSVLLENRQGLDPGTFEDLREMDIDANEIYGLSNMEDLKRIMLYIKQFCKLTPKEVQAKGACMMASVRRCAAIPYEYTNSHLRRQSCLSAIWWNICTVCSMSTSRVTMDMPTKRRRGLEN